MAYNTPSGAFDVTVAIVYIHIYIDVLRCGLKQG